MSLSLLEGTSPPKVKLRCPCTPHTWTYLQVRLPLHPLLGAASPPHHQPRLRVTSLEEEEPLEQLHHGWVHSYDCPWSDHEMALLFFFFFFNFLLLFLDIFIIFLAHIFFLVLFLLLLFYFLFPLFLFYFLPYILVLFRFSLHIFSVPSGIFHTADRTSPAALLLLQLSVGGTVSAAGCCYATGWWCQLFACTTVALSLSLYMYIYHIGYAIMLSNVCSYCCHHHPHLHHLLLFQFKYPYCGGGNGCQQIAAVLTISSILLLFSRSDKSRTFGGTCLPAEIKKAKIKIC